MEIYSLIFFNLQNNQTKILIFLVEFTWPKNKWIKGNFKQVGYYRVHYDDDNWQALVQQLENDHTVSIK